MEFSTLSLSNTIRHLLDLEGRKDTEGKGQWDEVELEVSLSLFLDFNPSNGVRSMLLALPSLLDDIFKVSKVFLSQITAYLDQFNLSSRDR